MTGFHVTTPSLLNRYEISGKINAPVRFWNSIQDAVAWAAKTGRGLILEINVPNAIPLPNHKPVGHAFIHHQDVKAWSVHYRSPALF